MRRRFCEGILPDARTLRALDRPAATARGRRLEELADEHWLGVAGRRTKQQCIEALLGSRRVAFEELLTKLLRGELMKICTKLKLDSSGRTKAELIARLTAPAARSTSKKEPAKHRPSQKKSSTQEVKRRQAVLRNRARASTALGWDDIEAEAVLALEPHEFEFFCRALLDCEWGDRHVGVKQWRDRRRRMGQGAISSSR